MSRCALPTIRLVVPPSRNDQRFTNMSSVAEKPREEFPSYEGANEGSFVQTITKEVPQGARQPRHKTTSRLQLLKELFTAFLNRAGSFDTATSLVLGSVIVSAKASVEQELTPAVIRRSIYYSARRLVVQFRPDLSRIRKRVVIVSDGEDTSSDASTQEVILGLQRARVVVDSIQRIHSDSHTNGVIDSIFPSHCVTRVERFTVRRIVAASC
ncbi:hypothetical protein FB451DRAFT_1173195 [Mycena latifolia]|nr:hypothetical protein FB451DRAFT_1173195 [Mycena latifolia]